MNDVRMPQLFGTSRKAAFAWLTAMHHRGLLFCLDDDPRAIVSIATGVRLFTDAEATEISAILNHLFMQHGDELHELAFEVVSRTFHTRAERQAFKSMGG